MLTVFWPENCFTLGMDRTRKLSIFCLTALISLASALPAGAEDLSLAGDAPAAIDRSLLETPCLATTGSLKVLRKLARAEAQEPGASSETRPTDSALALDADGANGVIAEVLDLEGLPIVRLSNEAEKKKLYFGISFDGVVGLHGKL